MLGSNTNNKQHTTHNTQPTHYIMNPESFILFAGDCEDLPTGGWHDYVGSYSSVDEALENVPTTAEWFHIVHDNTIIVED